MNYFANVPILTNGKGIVSNVIAAGQDVIDSGLFGEPSVWWQTSYNTRGNVHYGQDGQPDGGIALRANYAGIGYTYDAVNDVFYAPQPFPSWVLNADYLWKAPTPMPDDGKVYKWDELTLSWLEVEM